MEQNTGAAATVSLIAAILSWIITFTGHPIWGMILGLIAIAAGLIGALAAASPRVGGGLLSVIGVVIGILGLGLAVLGLIGVILF